MRRIISPIVEYKKPVKPFVSLVPLPAPVAAIPVEPPPNIPPNVTKEAVIEPPKRSEPFVPRKDMPPNWEKKISLISYARLMPFSVILQLYKERRIKYNIENDFHFPYVDRQRFHLFKEIVENKRISMNIYALPYFKTFKDDRCKHPQAKMCYHIIENAFFVDTILRLTGSHPTDPPYRFPIAENIPEWAHDKSLDDLDLHLQTPIYDSLFYVQFFDIKTSLETAREYTLDYYFDYAHHPENPKFKDYFLQRHQVGRMPMAFPYTRRYYEFKKLTVTPQKIVEYKSYPSLDRGRFTETIYKDEKEQKKNQKIRKALKAGDVQRLDAITKKPKKSSKKMQKDNLKRQLKRELLFEKKANPRKIVLEDVCD